MNGQHSRINAEINEILDAKLHREEQWDARWVAHEILGRKEAALGECPDKEFWMHCGYEQLRDMIQTVIRNRAGDRTDIDKPKQLKLGFERQHMQDYYLIRRDGVDMGVAVTQATDDELRGKVRTLRTIGKSVNDHADELEQFINLRNQWSEAADWP